MFVNTFSFLAEIQFHITPVISKPWTLFLIRFALREMELIFPQDPYPLCSLFHST